MEILLLSIGKISFRWIQEGIEEYEKRLKRYINFNAKYIPDIKKKSITPQQQKEEEGKLLIKEFNDSDLICLLDERGKEKTSVEFADYIEKIMTMGRKRLVFVIGGPYGFSHEVYDRADSLFSLSKLTMTHEMAKLFFTEQIYRSMTILKGEPYHHV